MTDSLMNDAVAAELRAERAAVNLTIQQVTDRTSYSRGSIMRWLNGERDISVAVLGDLAAAMGTDALTIIARAQERASAGRTTVSEDAMDIAEVHGRDQGVKLAYDLAAKRGRRLADEQPHAE